MVGGKKKTEQEEYVKSFLACDYLWLFFLDLSTKETVPRQLIERKPGKCNAAQLLWKKESMVSGQLAAPFPCALHRAGGPA